MINMMYLVLTALLALNVSKEVLLSFEVIANSLEVSANQIDKKNDDLAKAIIDQVDKEVAGGKKQLAWIKDDVKKVLEKADKMVLTIDKHIQKLYSEEVAGTDPETGSLAKTDETEVNYNYWMKENGLDTDNNGRGAGQAKKLRDELADYVLWANKQAAKFDAGGFSKNWPRYQKDGMPFKEIAADPKDMGNVKKTSEAYDKTWEYYIFHGSPAIANVAIMQKLKNDVRHVESELLELSKVALSEIPFKIDSLIVISAPEAKIVPAGIPFTADLYVTTSSKSAEARPKFSGSGTIELKEGGATAKMKINTTNQKGKQSYSFSAIVASSSGPKTLSGKGEYEVVIPGVRMQSAQVDKLYFGCYNMLEVTSPLLREFYNPIFAASGGDAIQSNQKKEEVLLVPNSGKMVLSVFNNFNGNRIKLDEKVFGVSKPPRPAIGVKINGAVYSGAPVEKGMAQIQLIPDAGFARTNQKDANYAFTSYEVLVRKGLGGPQVVSRGGGSAVAVVNLATLPVKSGETVVIKFGGVQRRNFQGKMFDETFTPNELTVVFQIR